jgi:DNA-binding IclR family transcriptional regulator
LTALESEGMVTRTAGDAYRLGPEVIALGGRAQRATDLVAAGHAEVEALAHLTGETATLEILIGGEMLILDEVTGSHLLGSSQSVGTRWPVDATSTGLAMLACLPDPRRDDLLGQMAARPDGTHNITSSDLEMIRRQGYAVADELLEPGFVAVGAPVFNHHGEAVAAISLSGPKTRLESGCIPETARAVVRAAGRISQRLGYQP